MAAIMASTYKAYLGEGMGDFGKWLMQFKIPHFGKVSLLSGSIQKAALLRAAGCASAGLQGAACSPWKQPPLCYVRHL